MAENQDAYRQHAILYVDDEPQALKYFEKGFRKEFEVLTASSAAEAWTLIEEQGERIGVLVADQRMPGQTGVELLQRVKQEFPAMVRILATAYSDLDSAIQAVNEGGAFRYITKPWKSDEMRGALARAMDFYLLRRERDALLRQKLSVVQHMLVMDRVRGLAIIAAAINERLNNTSAALRSYVEQAFQSEAAAFAPDDLFDVDIWTTARTEGETMVRAVETILRHVENAKREAEELSLDEFLKEFVAERAAKAENEGLTLRAQAPAEPLSVNANRTLLAKLLTLLVRRIADMDGEDRSLVIRAAPAELADGEPAVELDVVSSGPAWRNGQLVSLFSAAIPRREGLMGLDMDILAAFFLAHHHGGALAVHPAPPLGPGFRLQVPCSPAYQQAALDADWFDEVLSRVEQRLARLTV